MDNIFQDNNAVEYLIDRLRILRDKNDEIKRLTAELKNLESTRNAYQLELYNSMVEMQIDKIGVDGKTFYPTSLYWASIPEAIKDQGFEQLKEIGLDGLIKMTVNCQSLSAEIRQMIRDNKIEYIEDGNKWIIKDTGEQLYMSIREDKKIGIK